MQMIRLHVKKRDTERKKDDTEREKDETVGLDEKIRRIREINKATEKRFKEVEADKIQALGSSPGIKDVGCFENERSSENEQCKREMKGVSVASERKMAKGRGQRLLEMSKEPLKAKDFELKARESSKILQENPSNERLKAKDFESMARESLKTHEEKNNQEPFKAKHFEKSHPNEIKLSSNTYLSTENRNKPNIVEYFTNQGRFKRGNDLPLCSDVPSSGYINPLIDDRYLEKPKKQGISHFKDKQSDGNNTGFQSWNEMDAEIKGKGISTQKDKGGGFYGQGQDHTRHKNALSSGSISGKENVYRQENTLEDWSTEVMNLDEAKIKPVIDQCNKLNSLTADSYSHKEETDINLSEDAEIKDKNTGFNECFKPQLDKIPEVCQSFAEQLPTVLQNDEDDVKNEKVPLNKGIKEFDMFTEEAASVLQNNASREQETASKDKISETKSKENRPKVTLNTKFKKTLSNSSFEDGMSLLSPLDVPTNWGDLDFSDHDNAIEATGGVFYPTFYSRGQK